MAHPFMLTNYVEGWTKLRVPFAVFMLNSALICVLSIAENLLFCML